MHTPRSTIEIPAQVAGSGPAAAVEALARAARKVRTSCGDGTMVWRVWGAGEPLVLFHGGSGSWTHWFRTIPELSRHYELWVADIPGLGDSAMPPEPLVPASIAQVVATGLTQLFPGDKRLRLAGF
jgi:2-hydroxy-6-oxonona-2,4-dienedioate hydrolase